MVLAAKSANFLILHSSRAFIRVRGAFFGFILVFISFFFLPPFFLIFSFAGGDLG